MSCHDRWHAEMDPWALARLDENTVVLFGYCLHHWGTGGLSWTRSSPVVYLDEQNHSARTASGRRYTLGRHIVIEQLPTEESRVAYSLLILSDLVISEATLLTGPERHQAGEWISACKMSRHLGLPTPRRDPEEVGHFITAHLGAYLEQVRKRRAH